jgi:hypothetical protein
VSLRAGLPSTASPLLIRPFRSDFSLDVYYQDCVIGGLGAFTLEVDHPSRFETAIRRKLVLEIARAPRSIIPVAQVSVGAPRIDCASFMAETQKK